MMKNYDEVEARASAVPLVTIGEVRLAVTVSIATTR